MEYLGIKCRGGRGCPLGSCSQRRTDDCIPLWPLRPSIYPIRIDSVSRFESKSFRRNILESNAGGGGGPSLRQQAGAVRITVEQRGQRLIGCRIGQHIV